MIGASGASFLLRVVLPDRPGMLGAVATALGSVGADIMSVDVVERSGAHAVDDMVIELPTGRLPDALVSAAQSVADVRVESIRHYAGALDTQRELELVELMTRDPYSAASVLVDGAPRIFRAGWCVLLRPSGEGALVDAVSRAAPAQPGATLVGVDLPALASARTLTADDGLPESFYALDADIIASPFGDGRLVVLGRPGGPAFRSSEIARLAHLSGIAATIARDGGHF